MNNLLQGIDAIIFDFGNVLIDLDYPRVIQKFSDVARKNKQEIESLVVTSQVLQEFEVGRIGPEEFRKRVSKILGFSVSSDEFDEMWNSMLLKITRGRMQKVLTLGKKYKTYILSNTNLIHEMAFDEMILDATGKDSLRDFVDDVFYSHEMGLRKPDQNCFEHVIEKVDNYPSRMLFLDDRLDNVEAAELSGMKALQIWEPDKQLEELIKIGKEE
ncbi:MAG: HAD family phosphatase [Bacteroidota bacterium]